MATRRYSINPGDQLINVVEAVGAATATKAIELTVDLAVVTSKEQVILALDSYLQDYITQGAWPPA